MNSGSVVRTPLLICPFPAARNPMADTVHQQNLQWAQTHGLVQSQDAYDRIDRGQFGDLMGRAYPTAPQAMLQIIADWNAWMFLLDDQFDERELGRTPDAMAAIHERILWLLLGAEQRPDDPPHLWALADVARRLRAIRSPEWIAWYADRVKQALAGSLWESRNRSLGLVPHEADYRYWRPFSSGVYCYLALIEVAESITLPPFVRDNPVIAELTNRATNIICWSNDMFSLHKEFVRGDVHNLVIVAQHEHQMSRDVAINYVVTQYEQDIQAFQRLQDHLPTFGPMIDPVVQRYVEHLPYWIRANNDWSIATGRYQMAE